jgi:hypothetical protein
MLYTKTAFVGQCMLNALVVAAADMQNMRC